LWVLVGGAAFAGSIAACSAGGGKDGVVTKTDTGGTGDDETGFILDGSNVDSPAPTGEPTTCPEAAAAKSYVGCDYWPTVTANNVWSIFDFAVIVANAGATPADVTITGPSGTNQTGTVAPGSLAKFYLPWVPALKGADASECGSAAPLAGSVLAKAGAFHLVSSKPVTVYQFNALEYKGAGGPAGKSWATCPGTAKSCGTGGPIGCFSYSNDASLLLPSTAMTANYRVTGQHGWGSLGGGIAAYMVITATKDGTQVTVKVANAGLVIAGTGASAAITRTTGGGTLKLTMNAGDVAELVGDKTTASDPSGSLVQAQDADHPIQVITGVPCIQAPIGTQACDHTEESVFPYETLGRDYVVTVPTGPKGDKPGHIVRIYGNVNGTTLTYSGATPTGAPKTINGGQVVDLGDVKGDFQVTGDHEFGVGSFMLSADLLDPPPCDASTDPTCSPPPSQGDPSQSSVVATEQYRTNYVFLAPDDYPTSYADIVSPVGNTLTLDGAAVSVSPAAVAGNWVVYRVKLGAGNSGAHTLRAAQPVGVQVMGYGDYTSYQYPGGLNLKGIVAAPPPPF
jgi:hypothetical protein